MKELDFDELDRAVNSLMTDVKDPDPNTSTTDAPEKTLTITPSDAADAAPAPIAASRPAPSLASSRSAPTAPLAARRGGRFMDVVHPSSDMKKAETSVVKAPVSRQGATITPMAATSEVPNEPEMPPAVVAESTAAPVAPAVVEHAAPANEWPDPLEMANFKNEPEDVPVKDEPKSSEEQSILVPKPVVKEETPPLTSPFLQDAKVEKRPLGGAMPPAEESVPNPPKGSGKEDLTQYDPDDQLPATPSKEVEQPLPEELQGDLVAIESGSAAKPAPEEIADDTPPAKEEDQAKDTPASETKEEKPVHTGPVSIPQQYREEPNTGESESGSIYDTDTYHQPLAHPAKKKSGWLWVVWIVIILLVGGGAGAALYFLGIV